MLGNTNAENELHISNKKCKEKNLCYKDNILHHSQAQTNTDTRPDKSILRKDTTCGTSVIYVPDRSFQNIYDFINHTLFPVDLVSRELLRRLSSKSEREIFNNRKSNKTVCVVACFKYRLVFSFLCTFCHLLS